MHTAVALNSRTPAPLLMPREGHIASSHSHRAEAKSYPGWWHEHLCLADGLSEQELARLDEILFTRRAVRRGDYLYRAGQAFSCLYAVRSGCFKTSVLLEDGRTQVTGFQMAGDLVGIDGIGTGRHVSEAMALEDSEVSVIQFERLEALTRQIPSLQRNLHRLLSREIVREHEVMMLLGSMRAEERLAAFLLSLSQRLSARGYSANNFNLRMTREEIGSYLGLKLETVSRLLSRFQEQCLITVQQKNIQIEDWPGLRQVVGREPCVK